LEKLRGQLCSFGVNVIQEDDLTIAQSLVDITKEAEGSLRLWNRPSTPATPPPRAPIDLPFASFRQEPIPLHLQSRELPEERKQKQIRQKQHTRPQNRPKPQEEQRQKGLRQQQQKRPQNRRNPQSTPKLRNPPQLSTCRYRKEDFDSSNALFRRLKLQNTSILNFLKGIPFNPFINFRSFVNVVCRIEEVQLQILGQLHAIRSPSIRFQSTKSITPPLRILVQSLHLTAKQNPLPQPHLQWN